MEKIKKNFTKHTATIVSGVSLVGAGGGAGYSTLQMKEMNAKIAYLETQVQENKTIFKPDLLTSITKLHENIDKIKQTIDTVPLLQQNLENHKKETSDNFKTIEEAFQEYKVRNNLKHDNTATEMANMNKELFTMIAMGKRNSSWIDNYNYNMQGITIKESLAKNKSKK